MDFRQPFFLIDEHNLLAVVRHDLTLVDDGQIYGVVLYTPAEDNPLGESA